MKFSKFLKFYQNTVIIDSNTFSLYGNKENIRRQVRDWVLKGYLYSLRKGLYIFSDEYRKIQPSVIFAANFSVVPSYVSLEFALAYYGLIPEKVSVITSITTKKTVRFKNILGRFEYRSIKKELFWGMKKEVINGQSGFIATGEKALVDYLYFNAPINPDLAYFDSLRIQNLEVLNKKLLESYQSKYNRKMVSAIDNLLEYIKQKRYKKL